ncbi:MAG TPA: hypothetical protein VL134_02120 [Leptolyngbya sp.]|jgi:hypothetical protein|nr:hypothetical protein [Leptolyngbya sp.]
MLRLNDHLIQLTKPLVFWESAKSIGVFPLSRSHILIEITDSAKTIDTFLKITDAFYNFNLKRKEPMIVVGNGLVLNVA